MGKLLFVKSFLLIYIIITLFLGISVMQWVGLSTESKTLLTSVHYVAFPFLLIAYFFKKRSMQMSKVDRMFLLYSFGVVIFTRFFLGRSGGLSIIINILLEPMMLLVLLKNMDKGYLKFMQNIVLLFLCVESGVALFESVSRSILFATVTKEMTSELINNMRAYSLHGHPLQNSFIVCIISTVVVASNMNLLKRYFFFFIGYLGVWSFNSRTSIFLLTGVLLIGLLHDIFYSRQKKYYIFCMVLIVLIGIYYISYFIDMYNLGSRMETGISKEDGSSMARFMLIKVVSDLSFADLFFGNNLTQQILNKYTMMAAIENSILNIIFNNGLILAIPYFAYLYKKINLIQMSKYMYRIVVVVFLVLLNCNNILITFCPAIPVFIIAAYAFRNTH